MFETVQLRKRRKTRDQTQTNTIDNEYAFTGIYILVRDDT